jgi:hypothetical protein
MQCWKSPPLRAFPKKALTWRTSFAWLKCGREVSSIARQRTATRGVASDGAAGNATGAAAPFCRGRRSAALQASSSAFRYA